MHKTKLFYNEDLFLSRTVEVVTSHFTKFYMVGKPLWENESTRARHGGPWTYLWQQGLQRTSYLITLVWLVCAEFFTVDRSSQPFTQFTYQQ